MVKIGGGHGLLSPPMLVFPLPLLGNENSISMICESPWVCVTVTNQQMPIRHNCSSPDSSGLLTLSQLKRF